MGVSKIQEPPPAAAPSRAVSAPVAHAVGAKAETASVPSREAGSRDAAAAEAAHVRELASAERARIAERLQEMARASGRELEFRVDEASDKMVIVVRDQSTGELIRQIPDATALRISQRLESQVEAMRSILFEGRV